MVRVPLRHDRRLVPQQPLDLVEVYACLNQSRGEGIPEIVEMKIVDLGFTQRQPEGSAQVSRFHRSKDVATKHQICPQGPHLALLLQHRQDGFVDRNGSPFSVFGANDHDGASVEIDPLAR